MGTLITVLWFAGFILSMSISAYIFSLVFQVKESIKMQKIQIRLLHKIAEQAGANKAELRDIVSGVIAVY